MSGEPRDGRGGHGGMPAMMPPPWAWQFSAAAGTAAAIFYVDTRPGIDYAIAVLYVVVVMLVQPLLHARGILHVALLCMALTVLALPVSARGEPHANSIARCTVSLAAIAIAGLLAYRNRMAFDRIRGQEAELRRVAALLAGSQALSATGSIGLDPGRHSVVWSEQAARIFGIDFAQQPTIEALFERVHPDDHAAVHAELEKARRGAARLEMEHRIVTPDGQTRFVRYVAHRVDASGDAPEYLGALIDETATRQQNDALHALQNKLAHVARVTTLGEMAASLAHELRQPLAAITLDAATAARWLGRAPPNVQEAVAALTRVGAEAQRADQVIRGLRAMVEPNGQSGTRFSLAEATREILPLLRCEQERSGARIELAMPSSLPEVLGDRVQIQQVLMNLALNGLQAIAPGGNGNAAAASVVRISAEEAVDGRIVVGVADNGAGIAPEWQARIFEPFVSDKCNGMGMGLSISRSIVERHGGLLMVSSAPGRTEFSFTLATAGGPAATRLQA
ncbi:sensor histidine kinase [Cupriavidus respiraculi]|uniref:histidine kinase n=1 Tax=Cupriavidus respiraculi TaxID=195930 RepID=A0ABM8WL83_9BURK|nr:ATP-binding protein [Cupriavidus respiraculi]CAG9168111.1 Adaptive-response sensory-kinase SasA [Cupriavidus respiraculi]